MPFRSTKILAVTVRVVRLSPGLATTVAPSITPNGRCVLDSPASDDDLGASGRHDRAMTTTSGQAPTAAISHLTVGERIARGKQARAEVPRSSHSACDLPADRPDPVELLEGQA